MRRNKIYAILVVLAFFVTIVSFTNLAMASQYDGITAKSPVGTQSSPQYISGTYTFDATMTVGSGETYSVTNAFKINGASYTPTVTSTRETIDYTVYALTYAYVTGTLTNGEYSWYASVTIDGTGYTTTTQYFEVDNSIGIAIITPASSSTVSGSVQVSVTTSPTSTNTATGVSGSIDSINFALSEQSTNQWVGSFQSKNLANSVFQLSISATGTDGTSGSAEEPLSIGNAGPSNWLTTYYTTFGTYSSLDFPQMTGQYVNEGPITTQLGSLPVYPNSGTSSMVLSVPATLANVQTYYFPLDASPYYLFTSTKAANWTDQSTNALTMSGVTVGNNSPFNTPSISIPNSGTVNVNDSGFGPVNLSKGQWSFGFLFYATSGINFGEQLTNIYSSFVSGTSGPFYMILQLSNNTAGGSEYDLTTNMSFNENAWYSIVFVLNNVNGGNINTYQDVTMYVDSQQIGYKVTTVYTGSNGFEGFGKTLFASSYGEDMAGIFMSPSLLTSSEVKEITTPAPWQIYTPIQPSYLSVTQTYYSVTLKNGSEPWSQVGIFVLNTIAGQQTQATLDLTSGLGNQNFFDYRVDVVYSPFMSLDTFTMTLPYNIFTIPLDSIANIYVYNMFNQLVGKLNNYTIQNSNPIVISLSLTQVTFNVVNTIPGEIIVMGNGVTQLAFGGGIILANNSEYNFSTQVFVNGNTVTIYGMPNVTSSLYQTVNFYAAEPDASLSVTVVGYDNIGFLSGSGTPRINLYLDGINYATGETFNSHLYDTINVTIKDMAGQTLYQTNYTLLNIQNSLVVNITTPSFILQFQNAEQAPTGSVLATEIINISTPTTNPKYFYNTSTSIGEIQTMYLKEGTYHVYIHDNATFSQNITLNKSESWVIFGQKLVTLQVFLNDTRQILNNSAKLVVVPVRQLSSLTSSTSYSFQYEVKFPDGSSLTSAQLHAIVQNSTFSIYLSSDGLKESASLASNQTLIFANFTSGSTGAYNFVFLGYLDVSGQSYGVEYDSSFTINSISFYINVFAYNASQIGLLNDAGLGGIHLYVDGILQPLGQQLVGFAGQNTILITDSINQTLYSSTITLTQTTNEITIYITKPSWSLGLQNAEQAPAGTALATETIWINTSTLSGKFLEGISQTLSLYLVQGEYNITVKDNFTGKMTINLTSDQFYVFFGQKFLTYAQFEQKISQLINESAKLTVVPLRVSPSFLPSTNASFSFTISYSNGTILTSQQIHSYVLNGSFDIYPYNSSTIIPVSLVTRGTTIFANFTTGDVNTYNYILEGYLSIAGQFWGVKYTNSFVVQTISNTSYGLSITIAGPATIEVNTNNTYIIHLSYNTNIPLPKSEIPSVFFNMTAQIYRGGLFYKLVPLSINSQGQIVAIVNISHNGTYILTILVKPTSITGNKNASASNYLQLNVVPYNPTGPDSWQQLVNFLSLNADIIGIGTGLVAIAYFVYRRIRKKPLARKTALSDSETIIISNTVRRAMEVDNWDELTPTDRIVLSRLDTKTLHKIIFDLTGENRKSVSAMLEQIQQKNSKWRNMEGNVKRVYRKVRGEV